MFLISIAAAWAGDHDGSRPTLDACLVRQTIRSLTSFEAGLLKQREHSTAMMRKMAATPLSAETTPFLAWSEGRGPDAPVLEFDEIQLTDAGRADVQTRIQELHEAADYGKVVGYTADGHAILEGPARRAPPHSTAHPPEPARPSDPFAHSANYPTGWIDAPSLAAGSRRVLDAGTGDGALVTDLREAGVEAYGLDIRPSPHWNGHDYFRQTPMERSGFPDGYFDVVYAHRTIFAYPDPEFLPPGLGIKTVTPTDLENALREMKRILRPGGVIRIWAVSNPRLVMGLCESIGGLRVRRSDNPDAHVRRWGRHEGPIPWLEIERVD